MVPAVASSHNGVFANWKQTKRCVRLITERVELKRELWLPLFALYVQTSSSANWETSSGKVLCHQANM